MRLSRNRNWGHPKLVHSWSVWPTKAPKTGWRGLLVGDMSQPRGGPMLTGHASHQVGLDADIWLTPMPDARIDAGRAGGAVGHHGGRGRPDGRRSQCVDAGARRVIKAAAADPQVERIFVNPAIKKALCREAGSDRAWLHKMRPYWGHDYHFHVRIGCPAGSPDCEPQQPAAAATAARQGPRSLVHR